MRFVGKMSHNNYCVSAILRSIFLEGKKQVQLEEESCTALLQEDVELDSADFPTGQMTNGPNRYPKHPLYIQLSEKLSRWIDSGEPPHLEFSKFQLLDESIARDSRHETAQKVARLLLPLKETWYTATEDDKARRVRNVISCLGKRGLLDLLGVRQTVGSVDMFPPPLSALLKAFNEKHKPKAKLTVGARALSKHCHRDSSEKWWGVCSGTEQAKNEHAHGVLLKLLSDASWINLHILPHDVKVVEIRCSQGYGARWSCDGTEFRGFLEPQMSDGHAVGWRH